MNEKKKGWFSTIVVSLMAVAFITVAVLVLFIPQIEIKDICYFCCGVVVILGIYMIVRYFITEGYQRLNEYGFSEGVLFVLVGICGLISAEGMAHSFLTVLGFALLLSGVIKLQYALDLKCMNDKFWMAFFIITIVLLGCSVSIVLKPFSNMDFYQNFTCVILLLDGVAALVNIIYLNQRTKAYQKMQKNQEQRQENIQEDNIQEDKIREDKIQEDKIQEDKIQEDSMQEDLPVAQRSDVVLRMQDGVLQEK
ncbi:MAG: DUF308 domain-containing protein [Lachnospiraceae bacterium]